jgi:hypothetical protein
MHWSPLFRSPFGFKLAHSSNLSPNHLLPRYRCGCRPPIIFYSPLQDIAAVADHTDDLLYLFVKRSLWLSTTDHLRKSADNSTCANMDRGKVCSLGPSAEEQLVLTTIALLCAWAGISDNLALGVEQSIKTLPHNPPADPTAPIDTGPSPFEWESITSFRRASRIMCNLPPEEEAQATAATEVPLPPQSQSEPGSNVKLSDLVNIRWKYSVTPLETESSTTIRRQV